ncbi:MAG: nicotinate-nicotinamide nucleotide adenylyltransferase [Myxococcota bacterium]|nr:nicotinate-nicotinamide nucleotide adenylyltransferase [Myxococcota bacterium]MEC8423585.1 nicotinate-nicotinamide nucleotide adenylyltransferase [Myxococcota bacterium]
MRIAVYGGSFNPPHVGHAMVASWVRWTGRADAVWLVPVYRHAFENHHGKVLAPFEDRLAWCTAMAEELGAGVEALDVERHLPAPSFTVDTLSHLAAAHPGHDFRLVVGADVIPQVDAWRGWDEIVSRFDPIIVGRQGHPRSGGPATVEFPAVSSSDIRARLTSGASVDHLVTAAVRSLLPLHAARAAWCRP